VRACVVVRRDVVLIADVRVRASVCTRGAAAQGLHGLVGAFAAILAVVYTTRVFIYDLSIYAYITCISIKSLHDFHMWDRMHTPQLVGFVFWSCMLLNRIVANAYQGTNILLLQADVLFPTIILAFELIPFPSERFLSFQSGGFLDDWDVAVSASPITHRVSIGARA
jgi:hypothetical protein